MGIRADSAIASGAAVAFNQGMSPERMAQRSAAYATKEQRDQELRTLKATEPTSADRKTMADTQSLELQNALSQQSAMLRENNKLRTFDAYDRYDNGGYDVKHINQMLKDLEQSGSKMYGDIARVDKLTSEDIDLMDQAGINKNLQTEILNNPDSAASYVKITQKDGTTSFGDLDSLKSVTGYNDYASGKELHRQKMQREIEMLSAIGFDTTPGARDAFRRTQAELPDIDPKSSEFQELFSQYYDEAKLLNRRYNRPENLTQDEAEATRRARAATNMEPSPGNPIWDAAMSEAMSAINTETRRPSAIRKLEGASDAENELEEMGFWDMDFNQMSSRDRMKIEPKIREIEELGDAELDSEARKHLVRIKELTHLGDEASALTKEQTGLWDSLLFGVKKYIFDRVDDVEASAAYAAYRNVVRHALFGSVLTEGERTSFVQQFGSLSQQRGSILTQLKSSLGQLKSNYEAISDLEHPMVMEYRTGKTEIELENVIRALDDRIEMIDNISKGLPVSTLNAPINKGSAQTITPENRAILDRLNSNVSEPQGGTE